MALIEVPPVLISSKAPAADEEGTTHRVRVEIGVPEWATAGSESAVEDRVTALLAAMMAREARLLHVADQAGLGVGELLGMLEESVAATEPSFTETEAEVLAEAGVRLAGPAGDPAGLRARVAGRARAKQLVDEALSVDEAASLLGVSKARVRQRIAEGELVSIRLPEGHLLPRWQFVGNRVVPGLDSVASLCASLHPLEVAGFMTRPNVDLVIDGAPVSPTEWLASGGDRTMVADLAQSLVRA